MADKIEQAKQVLREAGYFVNSLWHIDDVKENHVLTDPWSDATDEQAMDVLEDAFANDATYAQIWESIEHAIETIKSEEV